MLLSLIAVISLAAHDGLYVLPGGIHRLRVADTLHGTGADETRNYLEFAARYFSMTSAGTRPRGATSMP
jgi:hypothetical protein